MDSLSRGYQKLQITRPRTNICRLSASPRAERDLRPIPLCVVLLKKRFVLSVSSFSNKIAHYALITCAKRFFHTGIVNIAMQFMQCSKNYTAGHIDKRFDFYKYNQFQEVYFFDN